MLLDFWEVNGNAVGQEDDCVWAEGGLEAAIRELAPGVRSTDIRAVGGLTGQRTKGAIIGSRVIRVVGGESNESRGTWEALLNKRINAFKSFVPRVKEINAQCQVKLNSLPVTTVVVQVWTMRAIISLW